LSRSHAIAIAKRKAWRSWGQVRARLENQLQHAEDDQQTDQENNGDDPA
jgi:hypothetical protein